MSQESKSNISIKSILLGVGIGVSIVLFLTIGGHKPATTCAEIDETLTKHMRSEIELSNNDFKSFVDAMVWCKEKGYEVEPTLPLQSFGDVIRQ